MAQGRIQTLNIFPVKSCRGISLQESRLTPKGLEWDRTWMVVDINGNFVSQRQVAKMATISTQLTDSHLILSHLDHGHVEISLQGVDGELVKAQIWRSACETIDQGIEVSRWLTLVLGEFRGGPLRLVRMYEGFQREVSTSHTQDQHYTDFSDGYPILVTNSASLEQLNGKLQDNGAMLVDMDRFRANIVVETDEPFIEHNARYLNFGESQNQVKLHLCKPCERCKVIGIDQKRGVIVEQKQPLQTLNSMPHIEQKGAYFGHNAVVELLSSQDTLNKLAVGQTLTFE